VHLAHPLLRAGAVEERPYQRALAERVLRAPHLLVLPTGLGKTVVALRVLLHHLEVDPHRRVLFLAPTKPLVDQHARFLREVLVQSVRVVDLSGETPPHERDASWHGAHVVVATPQVVQNDLVRGARDLRDASIIIYDEAHRALGNYPYPFIARRYRSVGGRWALGLTASPGNDGATVRTIMRNLHLEHVEVRTDHDADVAPYVHAVETEWIRVRPTPHMVGVTKLLERMLGRCVLQLQRLGHLRALRGLPSRKEILALGGRLRDEATRGGGRAVYEAVSLHARALKLHHGLELAETQGCASAYAFLQRLEREAQTPGGSKAARDLVREAEFLEAVALARDDPDPSPKVARASELVRDALASGARRVLVFANYRETADALVDALGRVEGTRASRFVGHAAAGGERGLTQREQERVVQGFRDGVLNVLVATAVGEEGLDLPATDLVLLHEPVASAIRLVQRRGRTGRRGAGRLIVLLTEGTRDEAYHWAALRRERKMAENLAALRRLEPVPPLPAPTKPPPLRDAPARPPLPVAQPDLTVDAREAASPLARELVDRGVPLRTAVLPTGDYAVGDRILVERKTASDLVASIKDGRLFDQLARLGQANAPTLLVEGDPFTIPHGLPPAAIAGALAAAAVDHRVAVVTVADCRAAAEFLQALLRRHTRSPAPRPLRMEKAPSAPDAQLRYILEGLPHVGPVTADRLLQRYGTLAALASAEPGDLAETAGVGPETAKSLHEVFHRRYAAVSASPFLAPQDGVAALEGGNGPAR
jgi:ERCC4-related helicase/ERCC4-type nuclease